MHLLVVEDDARLVRLMSRLLMQDGHVVANVSTANDAVAQVRATKRLDAIILDIGLPDHSGLEVARQLRHDGFQVPILVLTARHTVEDRVAGLDAGADDYLVKPFAYEELLARLRALRRRPAVARRTVRLLAGPISLDEGAHRVTVAGREVALSPREFALLECLLRRPGQVLTREQLQDYAWPYGVELVPNTIEVYIHLLRTKLGPAAAARIEVVRGVGYRLRDA